MPSLPQEMQLDVVPDTTTTTGTNGHTVTISVTSSASLDGLDSSSAPLLNSLQNFDFKSFPSSQDSTSSLRTPILSTLKRSPANNAFPPRLHHTTPSTDSITSISSNSSLPDVNTMALDERSGPVSSDFEFGSATDEQVGHDADDGNKNVNDIEGPCGCPNTAGKLKRPRPSKDRLCHHRGFGVRPYDSQHGDTHRPIRPLKRARIHECDGDGNARVEGIRNSEVQEDEASRNNSVATKWEEDAEMPPRTRTPPLREQSEADRVNRLTATPPRMSASPSPSPAHSPPSRPSPPTRFQSSSSCSTLTSASSFPKTPPPSTCFSNGAGAGSPPAGPSFAFLNNGCVPGSGPSQFCFEDGDLVLLIDSLVNPVPAQSSSEPTDPLGPPSYPICSSDASCMKQDGTLTQSAYRIHAARLAQASSAFASVLLTPLPQNPSKEDSARAASEIATRLNEYRRCGRGFDPFYRSVADVGSRRGHGIDYEYDVIAGCPAIRLEGDTSKDWAVALEAIYEPLSFQVRPVVFDALASALRISTRYGLRTLREWSLTQLRTTWPIQVERMSPVALPHAADAIALARLCDVPDILPAAFYALSVQRWRPIPVHLPSANAVSAAVNPNVNFNINSPGFAASAGASSKTSFGRNAGLGAAHGFESNGTDGGRAHMVLDPMDLRRLVMGREALQDVLVEIVASPLTIGKSMWDENAPDLGAVEAKSEMYGSGAHLLPSPSPSPSPKMFLAMPSAAATQNDLMSGTPSPPLSNLSGTIGTTLGSSSGYVQPTPQPFAGSSIPSFPPSNSSGYGFPVSSSSSSGSDITPAPGPANFKFCSPSTSGCRTALEALWRERLATDRRRPWGTWLGRELYRLATLPRGNEPGAGFPFSFEGSETKTDEGANGKGKSSSETGSVRDVCASCWEENRRLALWRLDWLCAAIPKLFML